MNDGGMDVSEDGGLTWTNRSNGLAATMFYDVDVAASDVRQYGGGAQDNGTITTNARADQFFGLAAMAAGWCTIPRSYAYVGNVAIHGPGAFRSSSMQEVTLSLTEGEMRAASGWCT